MPTSDPRRKLAALYKTRVLICQLQATKFIATVTTVVSTAVSSADGWCERVVTILLRLPAPPGDEPHPVPLLDALDQTELLVHLRGRGNGQELGYRSLRASIFTAHANLEGNATE